MDKRILQTVILITLGCSELMGCRSGGRRDQSQNVSNQTPLTTVSLTKPEVVDEPTPQAAANSPQQVEIEPDFFKTPISQAEFVYKLGGRIEGPEAGPVHIDFSNINLTDQQLNELPVTPLIDQLNLSNTSITDAGLVSLTSHQDIKLLHLTGTNCSDDCLSTLKELPYLELLGLSRTSVTDSGLKIISQFSSLRFLLLDETLVTDQGLASLQRMESLEGLSLMKTEVNAQAVQSFKEQRPNCAIIYKATPPAPHPNIEIDGHQSQLQSPGFNDSAVTLSHQETPERLDNTKLTSLSEAPTRIDHKPELPMIRPRTHSGHLAPLVYRQAKYYRTNTQTVVPEWQDNSNEESSRPNRNGWSGAQQSGNKAEAAARVGYTTPRRQ